MAKFLSTFEASPDLHNKRARRQDYRPVKTTPPSTTASQQQTWPPPPAPPRQTPQPVFTQDFDLFQPTTPLQQAPRRAPSLDTTLIPTFNTANQAAFDTNGQLHSAHIQEINSQRPPVPLFHASNSTGNLGDQQNFQQFQNVNDDITTFAMGGGGTSDPSSPSSSHSLTMTSDINVAYDGTFGDLSAAGDAELFTFNGKYDFELMPSGDNGFTAINDGAMNPGTISPKDLLNDSVPPSTSFTNLTTPGSTFLETPADDYQTSPLFTDSMTADNSWFSLFPDDTAADHAMERTSSNHIMVHPGGEGNNRKRSSANVSPTPFSPVVKHSSVAGVGARKRDKPLPPILVDEGDAVALKRARNTAAARKSRAKKVQERDELETQIADLKAEVEYWKQRAQALEANATE
ncbi:hypothetical protein PRZ48_001498 [Zasmidium cellare]|uniref:BZIP domain-containing protein n=1 Tax=Zasmidium cellare TaxID=395010 RepID=A0ABR0F3B0_ZASCE|nr:hypothetical protein PRZ48_001498 [Zasmidium cellare]